MFLCPRFKWLFMTIISLLVLVACDLSVMIKPTPSAADPQFNELAETAAMQLTLTYSPLDRLETNQTITSGESAVSTPVSCVYTWDIRSLPEITAQLQQALNVARLNQVEIFAEAYGEYCIVTQTNRALGFTIIETDFKIIIPVSDLEDENQKGKILSDTLKEIAAFPEDTFPGTRPGWVNVRFVSGDQEENFRFELEAAKNALTSDLENEDLLQALR